MTRLGENARSYVNQVLTGFEVKGVGLSGFYRHYEGGDWVRLFENRFAEYVGSKYAISVSSGTAALHTALECVLLDMKRPVRVLTSAYSFVASASSILMARQIPVFADIELGTLNMVPFKARPDPSIIILVHLLGHPADRDLFHETYPDAVIIEDACQALGARYQGEMIGGQGKISCFSFQETKSLSTLGEGGMITTNSQEYAHRCMAIRNHGEKYARQSYLGFNYRLTEAAAAFGVAQLEEYPARLETQRDCARIVRKNLPPFLKPLTEKRWALPSYYIVGSMAVKKRPRDYGVKATRKMFGDAHTAIPGATISHGQSEIIPDLPLFAALPKTSRGRYPNARKAIKRTVWFDVHRFVGTDVVSKRMQMLAA